MYHSITFGDKNTWDDWHIVPVSRPAFSMPSVQTRYVDIPGVNGSVDLSEAITGYPVYSNRTGSFEFVVMNSWYDAQGNYIRGEWQERYSEIAEYLHGRSMHAVLEDDPEYYYDGRFMLNEWRSEKDYSRITIEYNVNPYKWAHQTMNEPWLWDPFSFEHGVIGWGIYVDDSVDPPVMYQNADVFGHIEVGTAPVSLNFYPDNEVVGPGEEHSGIAPKFAAGTAPIQPTFSVTDADISLVLKRGMTTVHTRIIGVGVTDDVLPGLVLYSGRWMYNGQEVSMTAETESGTGILAIAFRQGRL